jgi:hypothetical protein
LGNLHHHYRAPHLTTRVSALLVEFQHYRRGPNERRFRGRSVIYNVSRTTILRWHPHVSRDPECTPVVTHWGQQRRIFDDSTERALASDIRLTLTSENRLFTSEDFRVLTLAKYRELYRDAGTAARWCCSTPFVHGSMAGQRFSIRRDHFNKRSPIKQQDIEMWTEQLRHLPETQNNDLTVSCDETSWRVHSGNLLTWWDMSADNVSVHANGSEQSSIAVLATMPASHQQLPLLCLTQGKTNGVKTWQAGINRTIGSSNLTKLSRNDWILSREPNTHTDDRTRYVADHMPINLCQPTRAFGTHW